MNDLLKNAVFNSSPTNVCRLFWATTGQGGFARLTAAECTPRN
ncbi:MAG: hypothetical protein U1E38_05435 [Rhodospirillales bacterium]